MFKLHKTIGQANPNPFFPRKGNANSSRAPIEDTIVVCIELHAPYRNITQHTIHIQAQPSLASRRSRYLHHSRPKAIFFFLFVAMHTVQRAAPSIRNQTSSLKTTTKVVEKRSGDVVTSRYQNEIDIIPSRSRDYI